MLHSTYYTYYIACRLYVGTYRFEYIFKDNIDIVVETLSDMV